MVAWFQIHFWTFLARALSSSASTSRRVAALASCGRVVVVAQPRRGTDHPPASSSAAAVRLRVAPASQVTPRSGSPRSGSDTGSGSDSDSRAGSRADGHARHCGGLELGDLGVFQLDELLEPRDLSQSQSRSRPRPRPPYMRKNRWFFVRVRPVQPTKGQGQRWAGQGRGQGTRAESKDGHE